MARQRPNVCGRLGQSGPYAPVDVCGLPPDHEGNHEGMYRNMVWRDVPGKPGQSEVISGGGTRITETGGNIRGND